MILMINFFIRNIVVNGCCVCSGEKVIPMVEAAECRTAWPCTTRLRCGIDWTKRHNGIGDCTVFPPPGIPSQCVCDWTASICPLNWFTWQCVLHYNNGHNNFYIRIMWTNMIFYISLLYKIIIQNRHLRDFCILFIHISNWIDERIKLQ